MPKLISPVSLSSLFTATILNLTFVLLVAFFTVSIPSSLNVTELPLDTLSKEYTSFSAAIFVAFISDALPLLRIVFSFKSYVRF